MESIKSSKLLRSSVISLAAVVFMGASSGAALATGDRNGDSFNDGRRSDQQSSQQRNNDDNGRHNGWWWQWWRRNHKPEEQPPAEPTRTCEERQADVDQQIVDFKANATTYHTRLSTFFSYQQNYVTETGITVDEYDGLVTNATQAKTNAQVSVDGVVSPTLDCDQPEDSDREALKQATRQAKDDLNTYRRSVLQLAWGVWREVQF